VNQTDIWVNEMKLCFDDILLVPAYSSLDSRTSPMLSTGFSSEFALSCPIVTAPMDSITGSKMAAAMDACGGMGIISRNIRHPHAIKVEINEAFNMGVEYLGCAVGIKDIDFIESLLDEGVSVLCVDVQHADHDNVHECIQSILELKKKRRFCLIVGNVCTYNAAETLAALGVDAIKVGIGPGAACSTRNVTGFGIPQLSAILDCSKIKHRYPNVGIIADGGLRTTGDMIKALWAGADTCMVGWMVAASSACPDIGHAQYRGMSSREVSGREDIAPEGVVIEMKYKGDTEHLVEEYKKGLRAGLAMCGAADIKELRQKAQANIVSPLSMKETGTKND